MTSITDLLGSLLSGLSGDDFDLNALLGSLASGSADQQA